MGELTEAQRQEAVVAAWRALLPADAPLDGQQACWPAVQAAHLLTDAAGLRAYQVNAQATAKRVLASTYPTLAAMLGEETLAALALILWQTHPPCCGDLGEWGGALPDLLASHPDLQAWPWLADSARLDWARHVCERAADATFDADSLHRLGDTAPAQLQIQLKPCVKLVTSAWPVARLWSAHQLDETQGEQAAAQALQDGQAETVLIWRQPWQAQMQCLPANQIAWMSALLQANQTAQPHDAPTLAHLLDHHAAADFNFTAWLSEALNQGWLWRIAARAEKSA
jgi:hypothetical protein